MTFCTKGMRSVDTIQLPLWARPQSISNQARRHAGGHPMAPCLPSPNALEVDTPAGHDISPWHCGAAYIGEPVVSVARRRLSRGNDTTPLRAAARPGIR